MAPQYLLFLFHCCRKANVMRKGKGLSGSFLLESPPHDRILMNLPCKIIKKRRNNPKFSFYFSNSFFVKPVQPIIALVDLRNLIKSWNI